MAAAALNATPARFKVAAAQSERRDPLTCVYMSSFSLDHLASLLLILSQVVVVFFNVVFRFKIKQ